MAYRREIHDEEIKAALQQLADKIDYRMHQKGKGSFSSGHEILGILMDEVQEYRDAVHLRMPDTNKVEELLDVAVAAVFGIACIQAGGTDW